MAQKMTINATVQDTNSQVPIRNAVGMIIRTRDSVLVDFKRSDMYGKMSFSIPIDTVQLIVRHPDYGDFYSYFFGSVENNSFELQPLAMPEKSTEIEEVVIYANKNPIHYRGDTLIYIADSFKLKENAVVEDLIKKLPGMTIDASGKITNQGKEIGQVLVDGDEFFGSDPTIATKNLAADGVDEVKVYEKDAEDGTDDKIQVLDLKLKDEAKKGYFGKADAAGGLNQFGKPNTGFYESEFLVSRYSANQKIAVYGLGSNTPKTSLNGNDLNKFGITDRPDWGNESDDNDGYGGSDDYSANSDAGIPQSLKGGFYLDQKVWKGGRFRLNYSHTSYNLESNSNSRSQYILTDTSYTTDVDESNVTTYQQDNIGLKFTQQIDSLTKLEIEPKISMYKNEQDLTTISDFLAENDSLTRTTNLSNTTNSSGFSTTTTAKLTRDFMKKNRRLVARYKLTTGDDNADGYLNTVDREAITNNTNYSFDQKKETRNNSIANTAYVDYVEPISKKWKTEFEYELYTNSNDQSKFTYNGSNGTYSNLDTTFSNQFETDRVQHRAGVFGIYENAKARISFGTRVRTIAIDNRNIFTDTVIKQSLNNLLPRVVLTYKFSQSSRLRVTYNTNSSLPSVTQLQPVRDNSNPNFVQVGNASLRPNYSHTINANHNMWKGLSGFYVYSGLNMTYQQNAFSSSTTYDTIGRTLSQTINVDHAMYTYYWAGTGIPIPKLKDTRINININGNFTSTENYINLEKNISKNTGIGGDLSLQYNGDSLNLDLTGGIDYNAPSNTLSSLSSQPYTNYNLSGSVDWTLPYRWFVQTDATYNINTGRTAGYNVNYVIWNASIQRSFLKTGNLLVGIEAYDILNQNISNYRTVNNNVIVDQNVNVIRRYFMAKVTLRFNNNHTKEEDEQGWW
jgi:hypothetical protein